MAILRAIADGEGMRVNSRNCGPTLPSKSEEEMGEQLSLQWREDHLFSLQQGLKMYEATQQRATQQRIVDYDREILRRLAAMQCKDTQDQPPPAMKNPQKAKAIKKRGEETMRQALYRMSGMDMTTSDAIGVKTGAGGVKRILAGFEPFPDRAGVRDI